MRTNERKQTSPQEPTNTTKYRPGWLQYYTRDCCTFHWPAGYLDHNPQIQRPTECERRRSDCKGSVPKRARMESKMVQQRILRVSSICTEWTTIEVSMGSLGKIDPFFVMNFISLTSEQHLGLQKIETNREEVSQQAMETVSTRHSKNSLLTTKRIGSISWPIFGSSTEQPRNTARAVDDIANP